MAEPFVGEIRINAFNFAPQGWASCDGQLLNLQQNVALYSLVGTTYGGNGTTTFGIPDLRGRTPLCFGQAATPVPLSPYQLGAVGGAENVTVQASQMPAHNHTFTGVNTLADKPSPTARFYGQTPAGTNLYGAPTTPVALAPNAITATGGSAPHTNMQPYLALNFCIALTGYFPPRN